MTPPDAGKLPKEENITVWVDETISMYKVDLEVSTRYTADFLVQI